MARRGATIRASEPAEEFGREMIHLVMKMKYIIKSQLFRGADFAQ
jgi:hypothetical protein